MKSYNAIMVFCTNESSHTSNSTLLLAYFLSIFILISLLLALKIMPNKNLPKKNKSKRISQSFN